MEESAVKLTNVYLDEVFWQVRSELLKAYPYSGIKVDLANFSNESAHFNVLGNEPLLKIALTNLLENGIKFSPDHEVKVHFNKLPEAFELSFTNQGSVIPEEELPLIFKPFHRGSNARTIAGHGIGLSLTERIIKLHRGSLAVESDSVQGTTFAMTLPQKS
jgi:signal transduction histidine kinase